MMMTRGLVVAVALLFALPPYRLTAQCPDGSPPPCRGARTVAAAPAFSVAVLSFENRSRDSADTFLGDGLADEIATQLGGVQKLTVRSRAMVRRLSGAQTMAPPALGRALQAAYLVDGSIQRAGTQLRVQVALLRSASGDQAWAQTYDRPAADLFRIQSDIARSVSEAIAGRLLPEERASLTRAPTRNAEAYQLYLRSRASTSGSDYAAAVRAVEHLERAVALDSGYAEAWALLSRARMMLYWSSLDRSSANLAAARGAAERVLRVSPDQVEGHVAMGYYYYWGSRDYAHAIAEFNAALRLRPNDAETWAALANVSRRQDRWDASVDQRRRAIALEPTVPEAWVDLSMTFWSMRRYGEALAAVDSAAARGADSITVERIRGGVAFVSQGRDAARPHYRRMLQFQGTTPVFLQVPMLSAILRGDTVFQRWADGLPRPSGTQLLLDWYGTMADRWSGSDSGRMLAYSDSARQLGEAELALDSTNSEMRFVLSLRYSYLGRDADALGASERAVRELPLSLDNYSGGVALYTRALVLARAGRKDEAVTLLEQVLALNTGNIVSRIVLREDEDWAVLRGNARFERLVN